MAEAHIVPLLMSLVQLTGKTKYLEKIRPYITGTRNYMQAIPAALQAETRADLVAGSSRPRTSTASRR